MRRSEKNELIRALGAAYPEPDPDKKRAFLRTLPVWPVSHRAFILRQARYIRKTVWAVSLGLFALALAASRALPADGLWIGSALTPFAALAAVSELARSALWGMEELELASRFGLKSVVLARMGSIGLAHLVLLTLLAALGGGDVLRRGTYLLVPYLLTDLLCLELSRRVRGKEALYVCGGAAVLVAGLAAALPRRWEVYLPGSFRWWLLALALSAALTGRAYRKTIRKTEELSWS